MAFDKDIVKDHLGIDDICVLLEELGAEPQHRGNYIVSKTVCHGGESHKLFYYDNTRLFHCFTHCEDSFDIFELVCKVNGVTLNEAVFYVANFFNLQHYVADIELENLNDDWKILKKWCVINEQNEKPGKIELKPIDSSILDGYPQPVILDWQNEFIRHDVCNYMNIRYDPSNGTIVIPHYDEYGNMIGIRQRTLVKEDEKYGKYRPAEIGGKMRNHPLGFNLYGFDKAKRRIQETGIAIVAESEKAVLQLIGYFGIENNVAVAMCGSSLSNYQYQMLLDCGVNEICIAIDRDYESLYDDTYNKIIQKMEKMYYKYSPFCNISFIFDTKGITGYKCSPTDCGKEIFMELFRNRLTPSE